MASRSHHIGQQLISLDWISSVEPQQLEKQLAQFAKQQLLPRMEAVLDEVSRDDQVRRFDRVVIDLGDIPSTNWQQVFCQKFVAQLQAQLIRPSTPKKEQISEPEDTWQRAEIIFQQFLFFLHHGRLPWWGATGETEKLEEAVSRFTPAQWRKLGDSIERNDQARSRLIVFCTEEQLEHCFKAVYALSDVRRIVMFFVPIPGDAPFFQTWRHYCWSRLFQVAAAQQQPKAAAKGLQQLFILRMVIAAMSKDGQQIPKAFQPDEQAHQAIATLPDPWRRWIGSFPDIDHHWEVTEHNAERLLRRLVAGESFEKVIRSMVRTHQDVAQAEVPSPHAEAGLVPEPEAANVVKSRKKTGKTAETSINVAAAGTVIIHPFIEELFRDQSLLEDNDFRNEECRHTAVHMLAYLAFGDLDIKEYDLLLPKLFCAMPWEESLLPWQLTDLQRQGCDELLRATLTHWRSLKSQSVHFLRQQFFWRNGKLKPVDGGWSLTIEKRAQDILLDKLPWGVGTIRLAWMKEILHVIWNR